MKMTIPKLEIPQDVRRTLIGASVTVLGAIAYEFDGYVDHVRRFGQSVEIGIIEQQAFFERHGYGPERLGRKSTAEASREFEDGMTALQVRGVEGLTESERIARRGDRIDMLIWVAAGTIGVLLLLLRAEVSTWIRPRESARPRLRRLGGGARPPYRRFKGATEPVGRPAMAA
jgi:hypothetical protein